MKKITTRLLTLLLALALVALPASAQTSVEFGNFSHSVNGKAETIDARGSFTVGQSEDGRIYLSGEADSGTFPIGKATVSFGDEIKFYVGGMTSAYSITADELGELMKEGMSPTDAEMMELAIELMGAYFEMFSDMMDPAIQAESQAQMNEFMLGLMENGTVYDAPQPIEILGVTEQMHGVSFTLGGEEFDRMFELEAQFSPGMKKFLDVYLRMVSLTSDDPALRPKTMMEALHALGMDISFDVAVWGNESGDAALMEMNYFITMPDNFGNGIRETVTMPIYVATRVDGDKTSMEMGMYMAQGNNAYVNYHITEVIEPNATELKVIADFVEIDPQTQEIADGFELVMDMAYDLSDAGDETARGAMQVMGHGLGVPYVDVKLSYAGMVAEENGATAREGRVTIDVRAEDAEPKDAEAEDGGAAENDQPYEATFAFDVKTQVGPSDGEVLKALDGKDVVKLIDMSDEAAQQLQKELGAAGMTAMGGLLRIPAVARAISQMTAEMNKLAAQLGSAMTADHAI